MPNVLDHVEEAGQWTLDERPFDELDALVLSQCVYMPLEGRLREDERCMLSAAARYLDDEVCPDTLDVFQRKRRSLFLACGRLKRYAGWELRRYVNVIDRARETQFCACTYALPDGSACVSFRGTDLTVAGWQEDLNLAVKTVPAQNEAIDYVRTAAQECRSDLILCGHSKGGHLAVYAAACAETAVQDRLRSVYTFDGPGMDGAIFESEGYQRVAGRICSFIPQSSVVGLLLAYHPDYTVVRAQALGLLQHDAMTWQVRRGAFVRMEDVDKGAKATEEAIHLWLSRMDREERKRLVETLNSVTRAAGADLITELAADWKETTRRMRQAFRALPEEEKRLLIAQGKALLASGADEWLRRLPQTLIRGEWEKNSPENCGESKEILEKND